MVMGESQTHGEAKPTAKSQYLKSKNPRFSSEANVFSLKLQSKYNKKNGYYHSWRW